MATTTTRQWIGAKPYYQTDEERREELLRAQQWTPATDAVLQAQQLQQVGTFTPWIIVLIVILFVTFFAAVGWLIYDGYHQMKRLGQI
ncbi:Hypothetical protein POVN_LOCUS448 [uncultured virus]|nr:Hypothetical protein POVN_LOCUS448 [uncultured virus]